MFTTVYTNNVYICNAATGLSLVYTSETVWK